MPMTMLPSGPASAPLDATIAWVCFTEAGRTLASASETAVDDQRVQVKLWRAPSWAEIAAAELKEKAEGH